MVNQSMIDRGYALMRDRPTPTESRPYIKAT